MKIGYLMQLGEDIRQPPFNGPANHVRQVCIELMRRDHQVKVLFRLGSDLWMTNNLQDFETIVVRWSDKGLIRLLEKAIRRLQKELNLPYLGFFESLRFALACKQQLSDFDLLYERFSWMNFGGSIARWLLKIPWVLEYNGDPLADLEAKGSAPSGLQRMLSTSITKKSMQQADHIVASGEGWRKNCVDRWEITPTKISVVENGTDLVNLLRREQLRAFQMPDPDAPVSLVYLGGFYAWHGISILLKALSEAISIGCNLKLVLIGSGVGSQEALEMSEELGISNHVNFTGQLSMEQYSRYLAEADIGLSPYCGWVEYSGLKLFDYKAAGLACIASGENGQPATIKHGRTGWVVPPCDVDALSNAIQYLAGNVDLRQQIGRAARIEAEELHGWDHTTNKLENIFLAVSAKHQ